MDLGGFIGGIGKKIASIATGGLSDVIVGAVEAVTGTGLTPEQRANLKIAIEQETTKRQIAAVEAANEAERNVTERIRDLEGTAKDLMAMPVVGRLVLFLRGCQRPVWGFAVLYMDFMVFSKAWPLQPDSQEANAFWIINFLVLGFLFGERTIQNVMPAIAAFMGKRPK